VFSGNITGENGTQFLEKLTGIIAKNLQLYPHRFNGLFRHSGYTTDDSDAQSLGSPYLATERVNRHEVAE